MNGNKSMAGNNQMADKMKISEKMSHVGRKIMILSGKGGVGKSTVAANLAAALAAKNFRVGLLDIDVHGPSIPKIMGLEQSKIQGSSEGILPVQTGDNLKVISIGFFTASSDDAVIWRGPLKYNVIMQFLRDVVWGDLDYLIIDSPPGTGDEPLSIAQLLKPDGEAVIVTTPQQLAVSDVRRCIQFCSKLEIPIVGVVENMSGYVCPHCGKQTDIFKIGGGREMAEQLNVTFLGNIPIDPQIVISTDEGTFYLNSPEKFPAKKAFDAIVEKIMESKKNQQPADIDIAHSGSETRLAIPSANGKLCLHFGHCQEFAIFSVNRGAKEIISTETKTPPQHEPGVLPRWLKEQNVDIVIAGGMGQRAVSLFSQAGIEVVTGAESLELRDIVTAYLNGTLNTGTNICDH